MTRAATTDAPPLTALEKELAQELASTTSMLRAACLVIKDDVARGMALKQVEHARMALVTAAGTLQGSAECMRRVDAPKTAERLEEIATASLLVIAQATRERS